MYRELSLPSPDILVNANLMGVIKRLKRNFGGSLLGNGMTKIDRLIRKFEGKFDFRVGSYDENMQFNHKDFIR